MEQPSAASTVTDGRRLRAKRTREAILQAHLDLMFEGDMRPTAARIAERAGVSVRTLWSTFGDLEALFAASGELTIKLQYRDYVPVAPDQPLRERIEQFCAQRARMLEALAPASRVAQTKLPFSEQLRANRRRHNDFVRQEIEDTFARELGLTDDDREVLLYAVWGVTTWPAWMNWRDELGLGAEQAEATMRAVVHSLLSPADGARGGS